MVGIAHHAPRFHEVAFVDAGLHRIDTLLHALRPDLAVFTIHRRRSGLLQMLEALDGARGLTAIHVIAHGEPGALILGRTRLTARSIAAGREALAEIGATLDPHGDLLVYGCNVASGALGRAWLHALADATGARVAAASALVGAPALGGGSELSVRSGTVAARPLDLSRYAGVLAGTAPPAR